MLSSLFITVNIYVKNMNRTGRIDEMGARRIHIAYKNPIQR